MLILHDFCMAHISWISSFANSVVNLTKQQVLEIGEGRCHHTASRSISLLPFKLAKPEIAWIEVSSSARSKVERVWCWSWILLSTAASLKGPSKAQQSNLESHLEIGVFKNSNLMESGIPHYPINFAKLYIHFKKMRNLPMIYDSQFLACLSEVLQPSSAQEMIMWTPHIPRYSRHLQVLNKNMCSSLCTPLPSLLVDLWPEMVMALIFYFCPIKRRAPMARASDQPKVFSAPNLHSWNHGAEDSSCSACWT